MWNFDSFFIKYVLHVLAILTMLYKAELLEEFDNLSFDAIDKKASKKSSSEFIK